MYDRVTGGPTIPKNGWDSLAGQPLATPNIIAASATRIVRVEAGEWMAIQGSVSCAPQTLPGDGENATVRVSIVRLG